MKLLFGRGMTALTLALFAWLAASPAFPTTAAQEQQTQAPPSGVTGSANRSDTRLPNGKLQREEILKDEYRQNVKDAQRLAELSQQLREDLEKNDQTILSVTDLRKTDEIEQLAKKIHERMRH